MSKNLNDSRIRSIDIRLDDPSVLVALRRLVQAASVAGVQSFVRRDLRVESKPGREHSNNSAKRFAGHRDKS